MLSANGVYLVIRPSEHPEGVVPCRQRKLHGTTNYTRRPFDWTEMGTVLTLVLFVDEVELRFVKAPPDVYKLGIGQWVEETTVFQKM
jgi:hypothetical protein